MPSAQKSIVIGRYRTLTNTLTNVVVWDTLKWMNRQINLYEAKTQLSRLVDEAANGDTIIIAKDGKPMAKLGPVSGDSGQKQPRKLGQMSAQARGIDWIQWWRDWKAADKAIASDFEAATAKPIEAARARPRRERRR